MYKTENVKDAFAVFMTLVSQGEVGKKSARLLQAYKDAQEVRDIISDVFEAAAGVKVLNSVDKLYISPGVDNKVFGYTNQDLRELIGLKDNAELYTAYFVILCLVAMFYDGEDMNTATRQYVQVTELESYITAKTEKIGQLEEIAIIDEELEFGFSHAVHHWRDLPDYDDKLKSLARSKKNKVSFILSVCNFLQGQDLVHVQQDREIYLKDRLDCMVRRYYSDTARKDQLMQFLRSDGQRGRRDASASD